MALELGISQSRKYSDVSWAVGFSLMKLLSTGSSQPPSETDETPVGTWWFSRSVDEA